MSNYIKCKSSLAVLSALFALQTNAADRIDVEDTNSIRAYSLNAEALLKSTGPDTYVDAYHVNVRRPPPKNQTPIKQYQFHYGVEVYGSSLAALPTENNGFTDISGTHIANIDKDLSSVEPTITTEEALSKSIAASPNFLSNSEVENKESKLFIWLDENDKAHLVWLISYVDTSSTPSRPHFIIDAHNGEILDQWEGMAFADGTGPGGNQRTGRYQFGNNGKYPSFQVMGSGNTCRLDSTNVVTYDMNHQKSGGSVHTFPCYENTSRQVNGSYSALNDAHAFGQVTFNMYKDWYQRAPLTQKLKMRVHYDRDYENAFWDGQQMTFGDGKNTFHPLVGLGVVAHEVSHGFTQQNSNLRYENQSGGLNESFSDIAAAAVSYYLTGSFTWQIGDKIKKGSGAMRYMDSPTRDGKSIDHTRNYRAGMNVHYSSGVFNKAFYLLSTTSGWDIRKAFDIYLEANQTYWNANETFDQAGKGLYKSAKALGYCVDDVLKSLESVGVNNSGARDGSGCGVTGNLTPTANYTYSKNELAVNFTNTSTDDKGIVSHSWNFGDGSSSSQVSPSHTFAAPGSYSVSLTVSDAEGESDVKTQTIAVTKGDDGGGQGCDGLAAWAATSSYALGDLVSYQGYKYEAIWWSTGAKPDVYSNVWSKKSECSGDGGDVNKAPNASFSHNANELTVSFTDNSTDDKAVISRLWNFGDGTSASTTNPVHSYANDGSYTVQLTVMDVEGLSDTLSKVVTVAKGSDGGTCTAPAWSASKVYNSGDKVSQEGKEYQANHWTQAQSPKDNSGNWEAWSLTNNCQ
ncbi:M4 family metallopeptidase [Colwelliaceae bacterium 6441]